MKNRDHSNISERGKKNLAEYRQKIMKPVELVKDGVKKFFESQTAAARFIADEFNKKVEHIRGKLKNNRSHIYGYDVIYLNVETACVRSTEQGTVQLSLF